MERKSNEVRLLVDLGQDPSMMSESSPGAIGSSALGRNNILMVTEQVVLLLADLDRAATELYGAKIVSFRCFL